MDRVFGTGHSSGAGFLMSMLASNNSADFNHFNFLGIAPVSAWLIGSQSTQVATMYIQGVTDSERGGGNGQDVVNKILGKADDPAELARYRRVVLRVLGQETAPEVAWAVLSGIEPDATWSQPIAKIDDKDASTPSALLLFKARHLFDRGDADGAFALMERVIELEQQAPFPAARLDEEAEREGIEQSAPARKLPKRRGWWRLAARLSAKPPSTEN